ncbi:DNA mismatch repair protein MutS [Christensenellaceae bacterium OttesenSCG-928-L17]|nr:DNA mismatch repair protein MutS [Christensenellaceae bacterium OttesenSCG-928-L17]
MPGTLTPLMRQYLDLKEKYQDSLLFFRLGDFYEMFFEDAVTAAHELEIVLTGRDCGLEERAPMCGVPYHSVEGYINRLIEKGYKVAICEQLTDPTQSKGLVERDVVRVITPGTLIEETMLDERSNNFILSVFYNGNQAGFAYADVSTGSFYIGELQGTSIERQLIDEISRIQPSEILANDALFLQALLVKQLSSGYYMQNYASWAYEANTAHDRLLRHFQVANLQGFGCDGMRHGICAAGALMAYLEETQKNTLAHIIRMRPVLRETYMVLDAATRRNLELTKPLHYGGSKKNTLLHLLDKTKTAMGGRMLRAWIEQPLQNRAAIEARLTAVNELKGDIIRRGALRETLDYVYDMERLCSRIAYGTVNARDCAALRASLSRLPGLVELVACSSAKSLVRIASEIDVLDDLLQRIAAAIVDEPPINMKDGGFIRTGYHEKVDELKDIAENGRQWLLQMEATEREATGIKNLRIRYNKVFGYFIEVTKSYQNLVPYHYHRKQTLANAERYITPALKELEEKILGASEQLISLEQALFVELKETLLQAIARLQKAASLLAELDVYQAFAQVAADYSYCMPDITEDGCVSLKNARHPVVERSMKDGFIPNDVYLNTQDERIILLTGPNMAGKSTYMRQIALIVLMAHIGCFVPAGAASICITDRIFTRVGASDDLAAGQSTFMVEMSEMANILHNATANSLLLLDEIGRGTSTFDGLSIAWAVLEHIAVEPSCAAKTLFATHYHELTALEEQFKGIKNYRTAVKEVGEDILFLHKVMKGGADRSFGIQVARLAGLPKEVVVRAKEILRELERTNLHHRNAKRTEPQEPQQQLSMLQDAQKDALVLEIAMLDVDSLTPIGALNALNDLHQAAKRLQKK